MLVCPTCPHCDCETEYSARDYKYYYFECSCMPGLYVVAKQRDGSFDMFHDSEEGD